MTEGWCCYCKDAPPHVWKWLKMPPVLQSSRLSEVAVWDKYTHTDLTTPDIYMIRIAHIKHTHF